MPDDRSLRDMMLGTSPSAALWSLDLQGAGNVGQDAPTFAEAFESARSRQQQFDASIGEMPFEAPGGSKEYYGDQPTQREITRQRIYEGRRDKPGFHNLEREMEQGQRQFDKLGDEDSWQSPQATPVVNLVPVEHNPHAVMLHAVDENPFAAKTPPNRLPPRFGTGEADPRLGKAVSGMVQGAVQHLMTPGMVAQPIAPTTPGMWSDEDEARRQLTEGAVADWGPKQALNMMRGVPLAAEGTAGVAGGKLPIRAYHGSPHDFEKFDIGKIGTGEGAQTYGHGLYFAEHPEVALNYRKALSSGEDTIGGRPYDIYDPTHIAANLTDQLGSKEAAIAYIQKHEPDHGFSQQAIEFLNSEKPLPEVKRAGKMYEVEIGADPEHFLHWDKPLSEQSQHVQDAVRKAHEKVPVYLRLEPFHRGEEIYDRLAWQPDLTNVPLKDRYKSRAVSSSEALREAGIPGIRYLDQGSRLPKSDFTVWAPRVGRNEQFEVRGPGNVTHAKFDTREQANAFADAKNAKANPQTHNYVVFDDKLIDIIKKYGLAGLIAGGAAHFKTQQVDHDPFSQ